MAKPLHLVFRSGCLVSVLAPIIAAVLYPRANWLFWFVLVGIALLIYIAINTKPPAPQEVANLADRILSGTCGKWDVDDYEHINPKDPQVRELWQRTMTIGGLPEEWPRLDEEAKIQMRNIISSITQLDATGR
jgi:hypothetical protein